MGQLKGCPFCGRWRQFPDARSAEMVGPHRILECASVDCPVRPSIQYHTDGAWVQGKGPVCGLDRDAEMEAHWNRRKSGPRGPK